MNVPTHCELVAVGKRDFDQRWLHFKQCFSSKQYLNGGRGEEGGMGGKEGRIRERWMDGGMEGWMEGGREG